MRCTRLATAIHTTLSLAVAGSVALADPARAASADAADAATAAVAAPPVATGRATIVIDRAQIDASGAFSVAELLRELPSASFGNFRPVSGSSAQSLATVDLFGLVSGRTLVTVDGHRVPPSPMSASYGADLNTLPLAAVERIEILPQGASAVYGADAVAGVVNVVMRRDFDGVQLSYGRGYSAVEGGDLEEMSALMGARTEATTLMGGASKNSRGMVFTRDQISGDEVGVTLYGNNYYNWDTGNPSPVPGFDCTQNAFYTLSTGLCSFDFNRVAAHEASLDNTSVFLRGEHRITDDWSLVFGARSSRVESFGRYAPTPGTLRVADGTPNDINFGVACGTGGCAPGTTDGLATYFYHRFAAAGTRDNDVATRDDDYMIGFLGRLDEHVSLEGGLRRTDYRERDLGRGYIIASLASQAADRGDYLVSDPFGAPESVLDGFTATISRDAGWQSDEAWAALSVQAFALGGGRATFTVGAEAREDRFHSREDSLSRAGVVLGSSGGDAAMDRDTRAFRLAAELPFAERFSLSAAARHDDIEGQGATFSPSLALQWQPLDALGVRAHGSRNFRVAPLDLLTQTPTTSSQTVNDPQTCAVLGQPFNCLVQVDATAIANPELGPERSREFGGGLVYTPASWLHAALDYRNVRIEGAMLQLSAQEIINRDLAPAVFGPLPDGLGLTRAPNGRITEIITGYGNVGTVDFESLELVLGTQLDLARAGRLASRLHAVHLLDYRQRSNDVSSFERLGWRGAPELRARLETTWTFGDFAVAWNVDHIGAQRRSSLDTGAFTTHDLQLSWQAPWNAKIAVGATNLTDRYPQLQAYDGRPWNFYLYDAYGRTTYVRYTQQF